MTDGLTFPLLDELAFEQVLGEWQGIHDALGFNLGHVANKVHANLATWHGTARTEFLRWWWGGDGSSESTLGAKGDVAKAIQMVEDIFAALSQYLSSVGDINYWLGRANLEIAEHTNDNAFTIADRDGSTFHYYVVKGTMHPQSLAGVPYDCYLQIQNGFGPFPYTDGNGMNTPEWFITANGFAQNAVEIFNTACETCIERLGDVLSLSGQIHWLKPYQHPVAGGGIVTIPDEDPVWELLSGDSHHRPWSFAPRMTLGKVTYQNGRAGLNWDGNPFAPANVPSSYFGPDVFDKIVDVIKEYGLDALSVLLVGVGAVEAAALMDTVIDSYGLYGALLDATSGGSIAGVVRSGYDLLVDAKAAPSVAEALAKQMIGKDSEVWNEFGDKLTGIIEDKILASPQNGKGEYRLSPTSLSGSPTRAENQAAFDAGRQVVIAPLTD